eukprot:2696939-Pyramimonas_sp.AAC.2
MMGLPLIGTRFLVGVLGIMMYLVGTIASVSFELYVSCGGPQQQHALTFCDWCPLRVYSLSPSVIGIRYGYTRSPLL